MNHTVPLTPTTKSPPTPTPTTTIVTPDEWPPQPLNIIKEILATPIATPTKSKFKFTPTSESAEHNWSILKSHKNLGDALIAEANSPLQYGSEFRDPSILHELFKHHPLWGRMHKILTEGINYPLSPLSTSIRAADLDECLEFGNHKGVKTHKKLFKGLMDTDVNYAYSLILPRRVVRHIPNAMMAPLNIIEQNTITELGEITKKRRLIHNQSKKFNTSGTSVNSRVDKDSLQDCMYGHCIMRMIHYILALCRAHPNKKIFQSKIDYKSAYRRAHLNWETAIQSITQVEEYIHISLRATFGGTPCPYDWSTISESVTDLANLLMSLPDWDPLTIHSLLQHLIPPDSPLPEDISYANALPTIVNPPS